MDKKLSIKVISNGCGILPHTIRIWEQRYSIFNPERTQGGKRLYSTEDLKKAKLLAKLIEQGHSISNLAGYEVSELETMTSLLEDNEGELRPSIEQKVSTNKLLKFLSNYNIDAVADEIQHLRLSVGAKEFIFNIVLPTMQQIGVLVAKGKYSVTQEHIISTIIRDQLSQIYLPNLGEKDKEVALATPEGNLHELAIIIADILCRANRVSTRYLGAAHPAECLGEAINALRCNTIILGAVSSDRWDYSTKIIPYLSSIDKLLRHKVTVILGGGFELDFPHFKNIQKIIIMKSFEDFERYLGKK